MGSNGLFCRAGAAKSLAIREWRPCGMGFGAMAGPIGRAPRRAGKGTASQAFAAFSLS